MRSAVWVHLPCKPSKSTVAVAVGSAIAIAVGSTVVIAVGSTVVIAVGSTVVIAVGSTVVIAVGSTVVVAVGYTVVIAVGSTIVIAVGTTATARTYRKIILLSVSIKILRIIRCTAIIAVSTAVAHMGVIRRKDIFSMPRGIHPSVHARLFRIVPVSHILPNGLPVDAGPGDARGWVRATSAGMGHFAMLRLPVRLRSRGMVQARIIT